MANCGSNCVSQTIQSLIWESRYSFAQNAATSTRSGCLTTPMPHTPRAVCRPVTWITRAEPTAVDTLDARSRIHLTSLRTRRNEVVAPSGGDELRQSLLGVVVGAVRDCGRGLVVFEGVDKLGKFLGCDCGAAVCWNGERAGRPGNLASGFGCHSSIIAPDRRARLMTFGVRWLSGKDRGRVSPAIRVFRRFLARPG